MARGQVDKAYATLERIARDNGTAMPLGRLVDTAHASHSPVRATPRDDVFDLRAKRTAGHLLTVARKIVNRARYGWIATRSKSLRARKLEMEV